MLEFCSALQGEWILSGRDGCDNSKLVRLYMYAVKCVNVGTSKDSFLTQVSDFAVLFGSELDAEVVCACHLLAYAQFSDCIYLSNELIVIGFIDGDGSLCSSNHDYKSNACLSGIHRDYRKPGWLIVGLVYLFLTSIVGLIA